MEKRYSYTGFMKSVGRNPSTAQAEKLLKDIYMDLFLKQLHREQVKERLVRLVDQSLDSKDEQTFMKYTTELLKLT